MTDQITKIVLGHTFRPMAKQDWDGFAGADEGTMICDEPLLLLTPDGDIVEIKDDGSDYSENTWRRVVP